MCVIVCNVDMFIADQSVQVFDTDTGNMMYAQTIREDNLAPIVCALAKKFETNEVRISGVRSYAQGYAEEIRTAYSLTYGNNDINVEVI